MCIRLRGWRRLFAKVPFPSLCLQNPKFEWKVEKASISINGMKLPAPCLEFGFKKSVSHVWSSSPCQWRTCRAAPGPPSPARWPRRGGRGSGSWCWRRSQSSWCWNPPTLSKTGSSYHDREDLGKQDGPMRIEIEPSATEQSPIGYLFLNNTIVTMVKFIVQHSHKKHL